jgi:hypothetical protein
MEHEIPLTKIRPRTNTTEWMPLRTCNIANENGIATFLGCAPQADEFALGALLPDAP